MVNSLLVRPYPRVIGETCGVVVDLRHSEGLSVVGVLEVGDD